MFKNKKILILEDDMDLGFQWKIALQKIGFEVHHYWTFYSAFDACKEKVFDLVISDIFIHNDNNERDKGGLTFINYLRFGINGAPEWGKTTPILGITGAKLVHDRVLKDVIDFSGANALLEKPITLEDFVDTVQKFVSEFEQKNISVLEHLRKATHELHENLHNHPILKSITNGSIIKTDYTKLLLSFYQIWNRLQPNFSSDNLDFFRPNLEKRMELLKLDLHDLGLKNIEKKLVNDSKFTDSQAIAASYILLGSSLGAKELRKNIETTLPDVPCRYFKMTPKEAGWPRLTKKFSHLMLSDFPHVGIDGKFIFRQIESQLELPLEI